MASLPVLSGQEPVWFFRVVWLLWRSLVGRRRRVSLVVKPVRAAWWELRRQQ